MKHYAAPSFWSHYNRLSQEAQRLAKKNFKLLKQDHRHPSLHFKKVGAVWSVRAGLNYRAIGTQEQGGMLWLWIGPHAEYDKLIRN